MYNPIYICIAFGEYFINHDIRFSRHGTPIMKIMIVLVSLRYCAGATYDSIQDIIGTNPRVVYCLRDKFINAVLRCPSLKIEFPQSIDYIIVGFVLKSSDGIMNRCISDKGSREKWSKLQSTRILIETLWILWFNLSGSMWSWAPFYLFWSYWTCVH